ncbi:hypothetical protein GCM10011348_36720 [Marinobacterium nitratireducens]|uniref:Alpha/beta hydrolase n=1 Tax=Marinobacterium nitratireducens TaxID=518897 RepID=A0A917ZMH2_9GAMM|nr:hypothetical protein [Marinobacterium nitratireducens]GGO86264.1 hypothetical protein GCM10011348_36720 [Marinobacterium nitratireducens]
MRISLRTGISVLFVVLLSGCGIMPANWGKLEGRAWCDVRYLDVVKKYQDYNTAGPKFRKRLQLSKSGYIYAIAAVLPLQRANKELDFHFDKPERLKEVVELRENLENGFDAMTFVLHDEFGTPINIIISFGGSNQFRDYLLHNFWIFPVQFDDARAYVDKVKQSAIAERLPIIAVGASLGGGLAVHVKNHDDTKKVIAEAWAFNPSPRIGVEHKDDDNKIFMLANKYEILNYFRRDNLGALEKNVAKDYKLIKSSSIYAHYRWVLTRQVLHFADLALYFESGKSRKLTEPMRILKSQNISSKICTDEMKKGIIKDRSKTQSMNII